MALARTPRMTRTANKLLRRSSTVSIARAGLSRKLVQAQAFFRPPNNYSQRRTSTGTEPADQPESKRSSSPGPTVDNIRDYDGNFGKAKRGQTASATAATTPPSPSPATTVFTPAFEALLADLSPEEARIVKLFRENSPSVVNVSTSVTLPPFLSPFNVQTIPRGVGSGFVWDKKGHIITNAHVIASATEVSVTMSDGTVAKAKVIGKDREKDIAVLQTVGMSSSQLDALRPVELGSSSNLLVGQKVFAIGNPFGLDQTLTQGIVSGLGREVGNPGAAGPMAGPTITNGIQTDAAINPGNSGGPLLDSRGRVVGINTAILDPTGVGISSGVGFAIPIDAVRGMVEQILTVGRVVRPALGISIAPVPLMLQQQLGSSYPGRINGSAGTPGGGGVLVVSVRPGGPADVAGIKPIKQEIWRPVIFGDIITGFNNKPVRQQKDLFAALDQHKVGDVVEISLFSPTTLTSRTVRVVLADREKLAGSE